MSDGENSRITITNIKDNEILCYPLVILKGIIKHDHCSASSKIPVSTCSTFASTFSKSSKQAESSFKIIIELKPGENIVTIDFCCSKLKMRLTYARRKSSFTVIPMYIINAGHDGKFQAPDTEDNTPQGACKRILTGSKLVQCLIAEKLFEEGLGRKTFQLENDECVIFLSNLNYKVARRMRQEELWSHIGREIMGSTIGADDKKYLGFLSCTKYSNESGLVQTYDDMIKATKGHVALGGGGLAIFGTACLYTWPQHVNEVVAKFEDRTVVDKRNFMDDSCYRGTRAGCFTTTLGSVIHELCHTFDLGHTFDGIMGRGFDNIDKFFILRKSGSVDIAEKPAEIKSKHSQPSLTVNPANSNGIIRNPTQVQQNPVRLKFEDETHFTRSCSFILFYHRYLNDYSNENPTFLLKYDRFTNCVRSTLGIRAIEIRQQRNEVVVHNWVFPGKILKYSFHIPDDCIGDSTLVVAIDNAGNLLKEHFRK